MRADILIVGQGLAGTLLAWELERAGLAFALADGGPAPAATRVAAGLINPVTGQRFVKPWRGDALLPLARETYRALEAALGVRLWTDVRVQRWFTDERERRIVREKQARGELAPHVSAVARGDDDALTIAGAARVDLPELLRAARARWAAQGRLRAAPVDALAAEASRHALVIDCRGLAGARAAEFAFVPWEFSKGEVLELAVDGLAPDLVLHRGHAVVPLAAGRAWVGATHEPGITDMMPTAVARAALDASARTLVARPCAIVAHRAGVRVNLPDRRPVAGRHPDDARLGLVNGLGAKGALFAPFLARQWAEHLRGGAAFDAESDVRRFGARHSSQASSR